MSDVLAAHYREVIEEYKERLCASLDDQENEDAIFPQNFISEGKRS